MGIPRPVRRRIGPSGEEQQCGQTFSGTVAASADDGDQYASGACKITDTTFTMDATNEYCGFRWDNVTVPAGATIESASMTVKVYSGTQDEPLHTIWGDDVDDAPVFTTTANSISARSFTAASVLWDNPNLGGSGEYQTPDIATIVQEITDRGGWVSGQAMAFIFQGGADGTRDLGLGMWDRGLPEYEAVLDIQFCA